MHDLQPLTENQKKVFEFILSHLQREDRLPSSKELQRAFGWNSATSGIVYFDTLTRKGYLERRTGNRSARSWWRISKAARLAFNMERGER